VSDVEFEPGPGGFDYLEIHVAPIGTDPRTGGASITFMQVGRYRALRDELERSQRQLETAYEELQSTVEELETTNEELQSTNEELETTNEELHSTNEELETMNEELQSTNEELETINNELQERSGELDEVNSFLESILSSLAFGVAVLDRQMAVQVWNRQAEDLWGLRATEVEGQHFLNLDIGLPVDGLRGAIRRVLNGQSDVERDRLKAVNRRGRAVVCEVTILPQASGEELVGAVVLMQAVPDESLESANQEG
jgi:two-component system CheB/CheR fusion protein